MPIEPVTPKKTREIARLARIAIKDEEVSSMTDEINSMLVFFEALNEVDIVGVEPMTSVTHMTMKTRADVVTDGDDQSGVLANAPGSEGGFFTVPKVME